MNQQKNEEMLAVYNPDGTPADDAVLRAMAHETGVLHGASHTYIYNIGHDGAVMFLLQRRSHNKDSYPDCLDISSAGHVEAGMDFDATARKELKEELGIDVAEQELYRAFTRRFHSRSEQHGRVFDDHEVDAVYLLERYFNTEDLRLQPEEVSEVVWMAQDEILKRLDANDPEICLDKAEFLQVVACVAERTAGKVCAT